MKKIFLLFSILLSLNAEQIYASFDVVAQKSAKLSMQALGIVKNIKANIADFVKSGDVLLELDYALESVGLEDARAQQVLAKKALELASSTQKRYVQVKSVLNEQVLDEINFKRNEAEQRFKQASSASKKYETLIAQKKLKAPFSGVISAKYIELGEGVASPAQTLFVLDSYPEVKLLLSFDEKYANIVKAGDIYEYTINGLTSQAPIHKVYPTIDAKTRKVYAEVLAKDIKIGSFGEGYIKTRE